MTQPLVSVVIPTYNRYKYLKDCIKSLITIDSDEIEYVIQDNTEDNSDIIVFLSNIQDERLKYFHVTEHISVMENSNLAINNSNGKYVCMIGDDDSVCTSILKAARYCSVNKHDACYFIFPGFNWPDMTFTTKVKEANLFFQEKPSTEVEIIDTKKILKECLNIGGKAGKNMPKVYHGLIARECLNRIRKKTGTFIPGPSPDLANATAVCLEAKSAVRINDYCMVSGYGYTSARGEGNRGHHYGKLTEKHWLPKDILERWNKEIPPIFSAETILAQSVTEALYHMHAEQLLADFNYGSLYASFLWHHKEASNQMLRFCLSKPTRLFKLIKGIFERYKLRKEYMSHSHERQNFKEFDNIQTLMEAKQIAEEFSKTVGEYQCQRK